MSRVSSRSRIKTTTYGYGNKISSETDAFSSGSSPHGEYVAGMTAGEIGKGHSQGHSDYLKGVASVKTYFGSSASDSGSNSGLSDLKNMIGIVKGLL